MTIVINNYFASRGGYLTFRFVWRHAVAMIASESHDCQQNVGRNMFNQRLFEKIVYICLNKDNSIAKLWLMAETNTISQESILIYINTWPKAICTVMTQVKQTSPLSVFINKHQLMEMVNKSCQIPAAIGYRYRLIWFKHKIFIAQCPHVSK